MLDFVREHSTVIFYSIFTVATTHFLNSFLMVLGIILSTRSLFVPWMGTQTVFIIICLGIFLSWTFFSMFVEIIATLIFPPISAFILGLLLINWRLIYKAFKRMEGERQKIDIYPKTYSVYEEEIVSSARPHTKLLVSMSGASAKDVQ